MSLEFSEEKITEFACLIDKGFSAEQIASGIMGSNASSAEELLDYLTKGIITEQFRQTYNDQYLSI